MTCTRPYPPRPVAEWTLMRPGSGRTSPTAIRHNPSSLSGAARPDSGSGMEDTSLKHPPGSACTMCGSVAVADVVGNYLCASHAVEAIEAGAGLPVEETTTARM